MTTATPDRLDFTLRWAGLIGACTGGSLFGSGVTIGITSGHWRIAIVGAMVVAVALGILRVRCSMTYIGWRFMKDNVRDFRRNYPKHPGEAKP